MNIAWHIAAQVPLCDFHSQPKELKEKFIEDLKGFQSDPTTFQEDEPFSMWLKDKYPTLDVYYLLEDCYVTEIRDLVVSIAEDIMANIKAGKL